MHLNVRLPAERRAESESDRDLSKTTRFEIVDTFTTRRRAKRNGC
jgi:hypothetical protein